MLRLLLSFAGALYFSSAVSLHCSTPLPPKHGQLMTDDHYEILLSLFLDEKKHRMQLQQYVLNLELKVGNLAKQDNSCQRVFRQKPVVKEDNVTQEFEKKYQDLVFKFESIEFKLKQELATSENKTSMLEEEIMNLKKANQLQSLGKVQQQVQSLVVSNQARSRVLMLMYSDVKESKQRIGVLESNAEFVENNQIMIMDNITAMEIFSKKLVIGLESNIHSLANNQRVILDNITAIDNDQTQLKSQIVHIKEKSKENEERVGFTAFGKSSGVKSSGHILKFPDIKTSYGLSGLSTFASSGKFTCEKEGLYLVGFTVMSCSSGDSTYDLYKNNILLMPYYVTQDDVCSSGSGTIFIRLNTKDTLYLKTSHSKMNVYDRWSSFSISKIK